jgi:hypothetical protein
MSMGEGRKGIRMRPGRRASMSTRIRRGLRRIRHGGDAGKNGHPSPGAFPLVTTGLRRGRTSGQGPELIRQRRIEVVRGFHAARMQARHTPRAEPCHRNQARSWSVAFRQNDFRAGGGLRHELC